MDKKLLMLCAGVLIGGCAEQVSVGGFASTTNRFVLVTSPLDKTDANAITAVGSIRTGNGGTIDVLYWPKTAFMPTQTITIESLPSLGAPADIVVSVPLSRAFAVKDNLIDVTATANDIQSPNAPVDLSFVRLVSAIQSGQASVSVSGGSPASCLLACGSYAPAYGDNSIGLPKSGLAPVTKLVVSPYQDSVHLQVSEDLTGFKSYAVSVFAADSSEAPTAENLSAGLSFPVDTTGTVVGTAQHTIGAAELGISPQSLRPDDHAAVNVLLAAIAEGRAFLVIRGTQGASLSPTYAFFKFTRS